MKDILSKLFGFLKYILLIVTFGLVFYGIMKTFARLDKPISEAKDIFIPFAFVLIVFLLNIISRSKSIGENLLFNFVSCFAFMTMILVCLRSLFDKSMLLYYKYEIDFNPAYFADNLSIVKYMLYMLGASDILILLSGLINKTKNKEAIALENNKSILESYEKESIKKARAKKEETDEEEKVHKK